MIRTDRWTWALVAAAASVLGYVVVRSAWIADDALITFRSVQNFVDGYGPRWNVEDRVQTYTHPLWMLGLSGMRLLTGDLVLGAHVLALLCSGGAIALVIRLSGAPAAACAALIALLGSRAFVDYSASGLENPLTHLLLGTFAWLLVGRDPTTRRYSGMVLVASLAMLNRMDTALLVGPAVAMAAWQQMRAIGWRATALATGKWSAPFWLWLGFASIYYGTPFPIAAYAKAFCSGVPPADLVEQATRYYAWTWRHDPITLVVIASGLGSTLLWSRNLRLLAVGGILYLTYLFRIGGDFMGGRFFAAPCFCAVLGGMLVAQRTRPRLAWLLCVALLLLWWPGREATLMAARADYQNREIEADGIADERGFYYQQFGWLSSSPNQILPFGTLDLALRREREAGRSKVTDVRIVPGYAIGAIALWLGRDGYLLDPLLCDPLLARLPGYDLEDWRIGHVKRRLPAGYLESIRTGQNRIEDPNLHAYWDTLRSVLRDDVFSPKRLSALWRLWTHADADRLERYVRDRYPSPRQPNLPAAELLARLPDGTPFYDPRVHALNPAGLRIHWPERQFGAALQVGLDALDTYRVTFWVGDHSQGRVDLASGGAQLDGLRDCQVEIPAPIRAAGFDAVTIEANASDDGVSAVGYVRVRQ